MKVYFVRVLRRGNRTKLCAVLGMFVVATLWVLSRPDIDNPRRDENEVRLPDLDLDPTFKHILIWNNYRIVNPHGTPLGRSVFAPCRVTNCELWDRREEDLPPEGFDALVFLGIGSEPDLPLVRRPQQRYIFVLGESPGTWPVFHNFKNFFNWTATYRRDSDIYVPNFDVRSTDKFRDPGSILQVWREPIFENMSDISETIANKSKLVTWFASHSATQSDRELYVDELSKYIQVDVYGWGRRLSCSRADTSCDVMLDTTYKFYLSFENSLCVDHVTETFLRGLSHNVVPVVYGGADYELYAPPLSYINVKDFASPRALARYLHYLDQHPEEYRKYFWWKQFYEYLDYPKWWCEMCEKLHNPEEPNHVYPDIASWWNYQGVCTSPKDFFKEA